MLHFTFMIVFLAGGCLADVSHLSSEYSDETTATPPPPPRPYNFQYSAGRYPGHVDRVQQESSDGSGTIRGSYSYVDPKQKIRTVEYTADKNGFQPRLINFEDTQAAPQDSKAVKLAKEKHYALYERIAEQNAADLPVYAPRETVSVARAKNNHFALYKKIAEEHAAIAAERAAELAYAEETSGADDVEQHATHYNN